MTVVASSFLTLFFIGKHLDLKNDRYKMIDLIVHHLKKKAGCDIVFIDSGDDPDLTAYVAGSVASWGQAFYVSADKNALGPIDAAKSYLKSQISSYENLFIINSGFVFSSDYQDDFLEKGVCLHLSISEETSGDFYEISEAGHILQIHKQLPANWNDAYRAVGSFFIKTAIFKEIPNHFQSFDKKMIEWFYEQQLCFGRPIGGFYVNLEQWQSNRIDRLASWLTRGFRPCLFLDRDGVMIEDTAYPHKAEHAKILKDIIPIIKKALSARWHVIVVSNQAGIAKGYFTFEDYTAFTSYLKQMFLAEGVDVQKWQACPYEASGSVTAFAKVSLLRKPEAGMFLRSMEQQGIDRGRSIMIGDKPSDVIWHLRLKTFLLRGKYEIPEKFRNISYDNFQEMADALSEFF